ncbi:MAG: biotin--[acetyl-CoA-carboxylase] ligase [Sulfolobales archaeon]
MFNIYRVGVCTSTQDIGRRLAEEGWSEGTVVIADKMTSGRGRLGREWVADEGGLWMTIILRPKVLSSLQLINLVAGLSVVEGIRKLYEVPLKLKWPNDVVLSGRKLCGILCEGKFGGNVFDYILLGIGINVNNRLREDLKDTAISLKDYLGFEVDLQSLLTEVLKSFSNYYAALLTGDVNGIVNRWRRYSITIGRRVKVIMPDGIITGTAIDIDVDGSLIVETYEGITKVYCGDVVHLIHD